MVHSVGLSARVSLGKKDWLNTFTRSLKGFSIIEVYLGIKPNCGSTTSTRNC